MRAILVADSSLFPFFMVSGADGINCRLRNRSAGDGAPALPLIAADFYWLLPVFRFPMLM